MRNLLKVKLVANVICVLALAEYGPDYVNTFWTAMLLLCCVTLMALSIVEDVYGLWMIKKC